MNDLERRLANLTPDQRAALEAKLEQKRKAVAELERIPARSAADGNPLSFAERRLWIVDRIEPDHPFYNMPLAAELAGPLDLELLHTALGAVAQRHETLRTTYHEGDSPDAPERRVHSEAVSWPLEVADAADWSEARLRQRLREDARRPFDISAAPLMRCHVYRQAEDKHVVLLVMHHIISDGWSTAVLLQEWSECYACLQRGVAPSLPPLEVSYGDFAVWQQKRLRGERLQRELDYWEQQLSGAPAVTELPLDHPRPTIQDFEGGRVDIDLSEPLGQAVRAAAARNDSTEFIVLLAAYAAWLLHMTRQQDLCVGTVVANRRQPALERLIGFFVNTLVVRCQPAPTLTFDELIQQVKATLTTALTHQDMPFERLVESLAPGRDRSHSPLFQTALVLQDMPPTEQSTAGLQITPLDLDHGTAKHDLTWLLFPHDGGYRGHVEFRKRLFDVESVERFVRGWQELLLAGCAEGTRALAELTPMTEGDRQQLQAWGAGPALDPATVTSLHAEVDRVAAPDDPAVIWRGTEISHDELRETSEQIAAALQQLGVQPGDCVLACLPRCAELLQLMFGIWRAGAIYVPVDPTLPEERRRWMAADCSPRVIVAAEPQDFSVEGFPATAFQELTRTDAAPLDQGASVAALPTVAGNDLAYIIYTSGSSGRPKGVEVEHGSIVRFLRSQGNVMGVARSSRVLHSLSPSFDGGLSEPLLALTHGGCSVVATDDQAIDPAALSALIRDHQVNVAKFPPPKLALLHPEEAPSLQTVSTGGDTLTGALARRWLEAGRRMLNGYGPTEASVGCAMAELTLPVDPKPPLGRPLAGQRIYVLDSHNHLAPIGVPGEICVGGCGVSRGYRNLPERTAQSFVTWHGERIYRTGDLGRWRSDGQLEFLGRLDEQVKIRGYRVEPGEVAAALESCRGVDQAIALAVTEPDGNSRLVGYVLPEAEQFQLADEVAGQVDAWHELFEQTHRAAPLALDPEFNIAGWVDSFTGGAIPAAQMREWADHAAERILAEQPRRVLEVGCGTGLILHRVAAKVEAYTGVDFLESSLQQVRDVIADKADRAHVQLLNRRADDLGGLPPQSFDMIVLNSVVQYFPSVEYLNRVLEGLVPLLSPGGKIFLGDVRNLQLQPALAAAIEIARGDEEATVDTLRAAVFARLSHEEELLVHPQWFRSLPQRLPGLANAKIRLKEDRGDNELARFRYDVLLQAVGSDAAGERGQEAKAAGPIGREVNGLEAPWCDAETAAERWREQGRPPQRIRGLKNSRVAKEQWLWRRLQDREHTPGGMLVGELKQAMRSQPEACHPVEYLAPFGDDGWLEWGDAADEFDVVLGGASGGEAVEETSVAQPLESLTNHPLRDKVAARLTPQWLRQLREQLPDYMVPSSLVVLSDMPRTLQGKVDRRALPPPPAGRPAWAPPVEPPADAEERLIVDVWESLLGVQPISVTDNFFDVGGHSLLAVRVMSEIAERAGQTIPLAALFQDPTPRRLAALLREPELAAVAHSLVPLRQGGDRTPLFCVHPAGGAVFCYRDLAKHLPKSRPVFGIQAVGIDGQRPPHETMEEMAEHYARVVRQHVGTDGVCHLAGWSLGGNVAFEVARRLTAGGVRVGLVALLDAGAIPGEESLKEEDFLSLIMAVFPGEDHLPLDELRALPPKELMAYFADRARRAGLIPPDDPHGGRHVFDVFQKNIKVIHQHETLPYAGSVHLFRPKSQQRTGELFDDPLLGWTAYTASLTTSLTPGDHAHMVQEPHVAQLAQQLETALAASDRAIPDEAP